MMAASTTPEKKYNPFWYGGVASMCAATATHPLDLTKVRLQTAHVPGGTMLNTFITIVKTEGILGIYSGLSASLLRQGTYSTARFGVYEALKERFASKDGCAPPMYMLVPMSMVAGCVGGFVGNPADIVNIRMQNDRSLPLEKQRQYRNALDGIVRIAREEGFQSLFRGVAPNMSRGILMTASQMVSYDEFKRLLLAMGLPEDARYTHFSASLLAGLVATTICSPVDVVKTRIMNSQKSHGDVGAVKILVDAIKTEGLSFAFRGWLPSFMRLGPQTILTFLVLEQLKHSGIGQSSSKH